MKKRYAGFTLLEMLTVVTIIVTLFGLFAIVASKMRLKAQISATKGLIARINASMEVYHLTFKAYPPILQNGHTTWPDSATASVVRQGVKFDATMLTNWVPTNFKMQDYAPTAAEGGAATAFNRSSAGSPLVPTVAGASGYLVDAWGNPIYYRKVCADRILIWSTGASGVNNIGNSTTDTDVDPTTNGDNISNVQIDF